MSAGIGDYDMLQSSVESRRFPLHEPVFHQAIDGLHHGCTRNRERIGQS